MIDQDSLSACTRTSRRGLAATSGRFDVDETVTKDRGRTRAPMLVLYRHDR
jgi:hypothetical protein